MVETLKVSLVLVLFLALASGCAERPSNRTIPSGPFAYHLHQVFVPVSINGGAPVNALLDTGATACAIDTTLARGLGLLPGKPTTVRGTAGEIQTELVVLDSVTLFGARAFKLDSTVYDLGHLAAPDGEAVALILGYPFLRHFAVDLDYRRRILALHSSAVASASWVTMSHEEGIPAVTAVLNGLVEVPLRIDTGASLFETQDTYLNITAAVARTLQESGQDMKPVATFSGSGVGGSVALPVLRLARVTLAGRTVERPFAIVQPAQGIFADPRTPGFVGNYTLDVFGRVVIDYVAGRLSFPAHE